MVELIREEQYESMMRAVVEPGLAAMREEIEMPLEDGGTLHAEVYNRLDARQAVVLLHGYTESAEKFRARTVQSGWTTAPRGTSPLFHGSESRSASLLRASSARRPGRRSRCFPAVMRSFAAGTNTCHGCVRAT